VSVSVSQTQETEAKTPNWGIKSALPYRVKVDSGIRLLMVNVLESIDSGVDIR
jgi:hypothetical protein